MTNHSNSKASNTTGHACSGARCNWCLPGAYFVQGVLE